MEKEIIICVIVIIIVIALNVFSEKFTNKIMDDIITNLKKINMSNTMDKLEEIFAMQAELNKRIGVDTSNMDEADKIKWTLNYSRALQQENAELVDSVPWKWWAKYQKFDVQNARVEVVDMLHFLVSLAQVLGMSAQDFYDAYAKKNHINPNRQDSGYVEKDENDCRSI